MPDRAPSLLPVKEGLHALNLKYDPQRVIVVAGTNGKGSVSATLSALLESTGAKVGLYTSPHLIETRERIRINSIPVSENLFVAAFENVNKNIPHEGLSHFEMLTLMAHWVFVSQSCDWFIYEVGLGGVWDATNAVEHNTSVICRLGLDHQDILGESLWDIAKNKLGIVRDDPQHKVIHLPLDSEIQPLFLNYKKNSKASFHEVSAASYRVDTSAREPVYQMGFRGREVSLKMQGARAVENSNLALHVFESLGFDPLEFLTALTKVSWPGRMDWQEFNGKKVYFSGDHNPQGIESLKEILKFFKYKNLWAIVGIGKAKDAKEMLRLFSTIPHIKLLLTETPFRGLKLSEYKTQAVFTDENPKSVLNFALKNASEEDLILVTGSLYLVGALRKS